MTVEGWSQVRASALVERVMEGALAVLEAGRPLTFRDVATQSGVAERTIYRHFPTRQDLLTALFQWSNQRMGFQGERPVELEPAVALVRTAFAGFDQLAPVVNELLTSPEGRAVRLADKADRQDAALRLVRREAPGLDRTRTRRLAAVVQLLMTATTWHALRDYWDLDGDEAAEAVALALTCMLDGAKPESNRLAERSEGGTS